MGVLIPGGRQRAQNRGLPAERQARCWRGWVTQISAKQLYPYLGGRSRDSPALQGRNAADQVFRRSRVAFPRVRVTNGGSIAAWVAAIAGLPEGVIAIDGRPWCNSFAFPYSALPMS